MTSTPYKAITWGDEPITSTKLAQMTNNDQWIVENMPSTFFNGGGVVKTGGIKIYGARFGYSPFNGSVQNKDVYFGGRFSTGCSPVIATGLTGGVFSRKQVLVRGLNGTDIPDSTGCMLTVMVWEPGQYSNTFRSSFYVDIIAMGW